MYVNEKHNFLSGMGQKNWKWLKMLFHKHK